MESQEQNQIKNKSGYTVTMIGYIFCAVHMLMDWNLEVMWLSASFYHFKVIFSGPIKLVIVIRKNHDSWRPLKKQCLSGCTRKSRLNSNKIVKNNVCAFSFSYQVGRIALKKCPLIRNNNENSRNIVDQIVMPYVCVRSPTHALLCAVHVTFNKIEERTVGI